MGEITLKKLITKILALVLKYIIISILSSLFMGTLISILFLDFSNINYISTLVGGFVGSISTDLFTELFKIIKTNKK